MIPHTPDNTNRPANVLTPISLTSTSQVLFSTVTSTAPGTLNGVTVRSATPGALLTVYDNASAASGTVLAPNSNGGAPLAAGVYLNFDQTFINGLVISVTGTVDAIVSTYPG